MKKSSLMGASVVAAALLAAAPVVAPVASLATSGTQVVKAADYDTATNEVAQKVATKGTTTTLSDSELSDFSNALQVITRLVPATSSPVLFGDKSRTDFNGNKYPLYVEGNDIKVSSDFVGYEKPDKVNVGADKLLNYFIPTINLLTAENANAAKKMYYSLEFVYSNAIGNDSYVIGTGSDARNAANDLKNNGGSVTLSMQLYDSYKNSMGSAGLLKSTVNYNVNNQRAAYVDYTDTLNAHVGDSANNYVLTNSFVNSNGVIRNYNGEDITDLAYKAGAITVSQLRDSNGHASTPSGNIVNGNFAKPGQYYQNIIIDLPKAGVRVPGNDWVSAVKGGLISVNGQTPSISNSDANIFLTTNTDSKTLVDGVEYPAAQLILKRTVNVDANQGAFKTDKINGVVTVNMNDGMAAQVYDENGKQVLGRALPNKSAWKTIEKRTYYKDGQVFYQVSTNEYVKAQDVTFTENSSSSNSNSNDQLSGKVNVTKYPSKVINILNDGYAAGVYAINEDGQGMHQVIGRFLPSGSAWINQGTAEVNGNLFYQVSTNEWVSANSVVK